MICKINSIGLVGIEGYTIEIEVDIQKGLPNFNMVGLPDAVVKESKERVRTAVKNSGFEFPVDKITVNFAPADIKKEGTHLDLAIAVGILVCSGSIEYANIKDSIFIGELSLNGEIRGVRGILPMIIEAQRMGYNRIFIPQENLGEAEFVNSTDVYTVSTLGELVDFLNGVVPLERVYASAKHDGNTVKLDMDFSEIKGQKAARRAAEIAASGFHNLLMIGPPGGGKTMLAQRMTTILPELTFDQGLDTTKIYSIAGMLKKNNRIMMAPPFRSPHHSSSTASIIGGGSTPMPGEVSLAHNGVLFLDELPEFRRDILEALRQPLEDGEVSISRVKGRYKYPSRFLLVCSMNPCPCGYYGYQLKQCRCTENQIRAYLNRISGPLLDRIDLHISIDPVKYEEINSQQKEEASEEVKKRVERVKAVQLDRFKNEGILFNSQMKQRHIKRYCSMTPKAEALMENAFKSMTLSTRAYGKILKVARTIADMEGAEIIVESHVAEAIQYRQLDRKYWA
jgi:magnesium chelatase family protein